MPTTTTTNNKRIGSQYVAKYIRNVQQANEATAAQYEYWLLKFEKYIAKAYKEERQEQQDQELIIIRLDDVINENDDFHAHIERVNVRDSRVSYTETYLNTVPGGVGDGYTASEVGFKIFLWWQVFFTDGTDQTYLAIVHLKGDPCEEHGWVYSRGGTTCVDPNS